MEKYESPTIEQVGGVDQPEGTFYFVEVAVRFVSAYDTVVAAMLAVVLAGVVLWTSVHFWTQG